MAFLLDTVALVLWLSESDRLGPNARDVFVNGSEQIHVSAINVWEIADKNRIGKIAAFGNFSRDFTALVDRNGFRLLDLTPTHAMRAGYLPGAHRDPFDRLIAAQALEEGMTVITNDPAIAGFGCKVLW